MAGERARSALTSTLFSQVEWVSETGSTNTDLLERAALGAAEGAVLVTDHQVTGRGRRGRGFVDPPGASLLVSVLLRPPRRAISLLPLAFGLAACEACADVAGADVALKWPNDLLATRADGRELKLAGILSEARTTGDDTVVVIGMGCNVNWSGVPDGLEDIAIALNQVVGRQVDREELLIALLRRLDRHYAALLDGDARSVLAAYRGRCRTIGRRVRAELAAGDVSGRAIEVDDSGHLVIDDGVNRHDITAAEIVHLRPSE